MSAIILIMCLGQSCSKDWLDIKADKRQAVPQTVQDLQAILDDVTINEVGTRSLQLNEVASDGHYYTDQVYQGLSASSFRYRNAYTWSPVEPFENISNYYQGYMASYAAIFKCNVIIGAKQGGNDKREFDHVVAQALFHRAKICYNLAQTYAPPYNALTASQVLGLPLRLNTDVTEVSRRSTLKQTYEQILEDLKNAVDLLPDVPAFVTRASKPAALGLLARTYLTMGDYASAFEYADQYLGLKNELLDYNALSTSAATIGLNTEVAFFELMSVGSILNNQYLIDQELYDKYASNDLRKKCFFNVISSGITFKGKYSSRAGDIFTGIATDEMYLIRAECYARMNEVNNAMKDLNDLLRTRWVKNPDGTTTYIDQTAIDETDALTKIFLERRKQLILRGLRWTDLRRLNQDPRFEINLTRTVAGQQYILPSQSNRYTFPFPQEVINQSGIEQNPGWTKS